ncbi:hypothetical protein L6R29_10650 [Myxococcota bacterium]|nr:hypothetical protein [Myxococcota bacterium]
MSWIYPERWSGWSEHARVGGGLFDDPHRFARMVQACWEQYSQQNDLARRTPLTPLPQLRLVFSQDALAQEQWAPCFQSLELWFNPTLNGLALPFALHPPTHDEAALLREPRHFFFHLESPRRQALRCLFLLGEQIIGAIPLGEVQLNGDTRTFTVTRRFGITTKSSDLSRCIDANPIANDLPSAMRDDLRYLGWRLVFRMWGGEEEIQIEDVAATGRLNGGIFQLHDGLRCPLGQALTLYEGHEDGTPRPALRLRMLLVPNDIQPAPPQIVHLQAFAHTSEGHPPQIEFQAWLRNGPLDDQLLTLALLEQGAQFQLQEDGTTEDGALHRYRLLTALPPRLHAGDPLTYRLLGQNRYGLSFSTRPQELTLQQTTRVQFQGPRVVQRRQLEQDWEVRFRLETPVPVGSIDLASLTLWLRADEAPAISIPLAHVQKESLVFRFLPRVIQMQMPLERILQARQLHLWLEQHPDEESSETFPSWRLCLAGNQAQQPRVSLRIVRFDASDHLIASGTETLLPLHGELQIEGFRLQILPSLYDTRQSATSEREIWDLVLCEDEDGPRRVRLTHQGAGWMRVQRLTKNTPPPAHPVRAFWLSCSPEDQIIPHPNERNPEGGPCFAFGLGWGQTQEMAQIRPTQEGFRLARHRTHLVVRTDQTELIVSPYTHPEGILLNQDPQQGWLLVDQVLLHYRCFQEDTWLHADITLLGYLCKRQPSAALLQFSLGETTNLPAILPHLPHIRLASQGPAGRLTFQLPAPMTRRDPDRYLLQEHSTPTLPQPLQWGQRYQRGRFAFSCWRLTPTPSASPQGGTLQHDILLDIRQQTGRKHFALAVVTGRLGYWSEGSAFLQQTGVAAPLFAPDHPRKLPDGLEAPAGELIVGTDPRFADLVIPTFYPTDATVLFSIAYRDAQWWVRPFQAPCLGQSLQFLHDGGLTRSETLWTTPSPLTPEEEPWKWWRCGSALFELSVATHDREEYPNTDAMLSLRGLFCAATDRLMIGGPPRLSALPLLGSGFPDEQKRPLFSLEASGLQVRFDGDAMLGMRHHEAGTDLFSRFQQTLAQTPLSPASAHHLPWRLLQPSAEIALPLLPPNLHLQMPTHPYALRNHDQLRLGQLNFCYRRRDESDGYPAPSVIPAALDLQPADHFSIHFSATSHGFLHPSGDPVDHLIIGRLDPHQDRGPHLPSALGEIWLGTPFLEEDHTCMRLCLSGYSPRHALLISRKNGQITLHIPAPKAPGAYHVVLNDTPQRSAKEIPLQTPTHLHINHLFRLRLQPLPNALSVLFDGYLLAHPDAPHLPVRFSSENRRGVIHLRTVHPPDLQLQPDSLPPSFRAVVWPTPPDHSRASLHPTNPVHPPSPRSPLQPHSSTLPPSSTQQATTPEIAAIQRFAPINGPLRLPDGEEIMLVDLSTWTHDLAEIARPPQTDRLLWFDAHTPHTELLFPPQHTSPLAASALDEGSQFAFGTESSQTTDDLTPPPSPVSSAQEDDGSSFAFLPLPQHTQHAPSSQPIHLGPPSHPSHTADFTATLHTADVTTSSHTSHTADLAVPSSPSHTADFTATSSPSHTADFTTPSQTADIAVPSSPSHTADFTVPSHPSQTADFAAPSHPAQTAGIAAPSHPSHTADLTAPLSLSHAADVSIPPTNAHSSEASPANHTEASRAVPLASPVPQEVQARIGFFEKTSYAETCFGYASTQDGWQIGIFARQDRILAQLLQAPLDAEGWMAGGLAAIWRNGDILPLQLPQFLEVGDLILCGPAAFLCEEAPHQGQMRLRRRWLWLPQDIRWTLQSASLPDIPQDAFALSHHTTAWSLRIEPAQAGHLLIAPQAAPALHWTQEPLAVSHALEGIESAQQALPPPSTTLPAHLSPAATPFTLCVGDSSQGNAS